MNEYFRNKVFQVKWRFAGLVQELNEFEGTRDTMRKLRQTKRLLEARYAVIEADVVLAKATVEAFAARVVRDVSAPIYHLRHVLRVMGSETDVQLWPVPVEQRIRPN